MKAAGIAFLLIILLLGLQYYFYAQEYNSIKDISLENILSLKSSTEKAIRNMKFCLYLQIILFAYAGISLIISGSHVSREIENLKSRNAAD